MTNRCNSITVVLEQDMREDDAQAILGAIRLIRGVLSVEANVADSLSVHVAEARVRHEFTERLLDVVRPKQN